jgi:hypothetical protein
MFSEPRRADGAICLLTVNSLSVASVDSQQTNIVQFVLCGSEGMFLVSARRSLSLNLFWSLFL